MLRSASCVLLLVIAAGGCASKPSDYKYSEAKSATNQCLKSGTRIQTRDGNCSQPGRSSGDLSHSHATTAAGALHDVSPAITIRQ